MPSLRASLSSLRVSLPSLRASLPSPRRLWRTSRPQPPPQSTQSPQSPPWLPPPPHWLEEEEEEEDRPHTYDQLKYEEVVDLINKEPTSIADLATRVVSAEHRSKKPLNLIGDSLLHEVIARRKIDLALAIIALSDDFNRRIIRHKNYYGNTPLHIAAMKGYRTVAKALLNRDKSLAHKRNRNGETPLHKAVQFGHLDVFNIIIEVGGRDMAYDRTDDGFTILHCAIMHDQTKAALDIVKKIPELISTRNACGASPLQLMAVYFRKPPETGILNSLLYKYIPLEKVTSLEEEWKIDEESGIIDIQGIIPPDRGNWWMSLPGPYHMYTHIIRNLGKRIVKETEEMSNYEMSMKLLELLILEAQGFEFYIMGFTPESSIKRPAGGRGSYIRPLLLARTNSELIAEEDTDGRDELPEVNYRIRWEESPLIIGVKLGLDDLVIKILQVSPELATYVDYDGTNVLQVAVKYGRRRVVNAIKEGKRLPGWLLTDLESHTNNTLLHIAASNTISKESDPLRLQDELEWFEMMEKIVPKNLRNYRNRKWMTAREVFDEKHERTLNDCRGQLKDIARTCSPLLAAVVFTSSFYIPGEHNRESNRLAFKIFSHVYMVGFSCAATSLIMFLMLVVTPFKQRDFRRKVPWYYVMACFLLAMSMAAFSVSFSCNMYLQIYGKQRKAYADLATLLLELLLVPFLCALALSITRASWTCDTLKRLAK